MISKLRNTQLTRLEYSILFILITFMMNVVYLFFMVARPDNYSLLDVLLLVNTFAFLLFYILLRRIRTSHRFTINMVTLKQIMRVLLTSMVFYYIAGFMEIFTNVDNTALIISEKILQGNPALALNFSVINFQTLDYVMSLFRGIHSPLVLLIIILYYQRLFYNTSNIEVLPEEEKTYDPFLYDQTIPFAWTMLTVLSFLSMNLITLNYDLFGALEMLISIPLFMLSFLGLVPSVVWQQTKHKKTIPSMMTYNHHYLRKLLLFNFIFVVLLGVYHYISYTQDTLSYRYITTGLSFVFILYLFWRHQRVYQLD